MTGPLIPEHVLAAANRVMHADYHGSIEERREAFELDAQVVAGAVALLAVRPEEIPRGGYMKAEGP